jgi:hypothetical protein
MSLVEVGALLGRTTDSMRRMIREGTLPAPATGGGRHGLKLYWRRSDILLWIELGLPNRKAFEEARHAATKRRKR